MRRRDVATVVAVVAGLFLVEAALMAHVAYLAWSSLSVVGAQPELESVFSGSGRGALIFGALGLIAVGSSIGIFRGKSWASSLWVAASAAIIIAIAGSVIFIGYPWHRFAFEFGAVIFSLWCISRLSDAR